MKFSQEAFEGLWSQNPVKGPQALLAILFCIEATHCTFKQLDYFHHTAARVWDDYPGFGPFHLFFFLFVCLF